MASTPSGRAPPEIVKSGGYALLTHAYVRKQRHDPGGRSRRPERHDGGVSPGNPRESAAVSPLPRAATRSHGRGRGDPPGRLREGHGESGDRRARGEHG